MKMTGQEYAAVMSRACGELVKLQVENERLRSAIKKYLSHQLSHQDSYRVLRAALDAADGQG